MKKIITIVGSSIFENYLKEVNDIATSIHLKCIKNKKAKDLEKEKERCERIQENVSSWAKEKINKIQKGVSIEIKSLLELKSKAGDDFKIYLICLDTILSNLAGKIILNTLNELSDYKDKVELIEIRDKKDFKSEVKDLINQIYNIAYKDWQNVIINITGASKAIIPYLTILASINCCPVYHMLEETNTLIEIPCMPTNIKKETFESNEEVFFKLEKEGIKELSIELIENPEIRPLLEFVDNKHYLNLPGMIFWKKYSSNYEYIYISELIKNYLNNESFKKSVLKLSKMLRENSQHPDLNYSIRNIDLPEGFKVFKGDLQVRILYNKKGEFLYIGLVTIGDNAEDEFVKLFETEKEKVKNLNEYKFYKIKRE